MTAVCGQHRPVFAAFTEQESTDIITAYGNHCSPVRISVRSLPAHPLLRMNDYGTDERGKMLLMRCMNNPGWIERCLFSLAYFSQVRDEKKGHRSVRGSFRGDITRITSKMCLRPDLLARSDRRCARISRAPDTRALLLSPCALSNAEDTAAV